MAFDTENHPGVCENPSAASNGFVLNHSMLRVKDPERALDFYTRIMGMRLLRKLDFPEMKFSLYFLHRSEASAPRPTTLASAPPGRLHSGASSNSPTTGVPKPTPNFRITTATRSLRALATSASRCRTSMARWLGSMKTRFSTSRGLTLGR